MKNTRHVHLLHNPKAGDRDHVKDELIHLIESHGFTCQYASIKDKGWKRFRKDTALIVIAGGDGTIREVMRKLLTRSVLDKRVPVALLPSGTANNFAKTMGISSRRADFERLLVNWKTEKIDVAAVGNLRDAHFFIEGLGGGLIPKLITEMKARDLSALATADEELQAALQQLLEIAEHYRAKRARITIDDVLYEDDYLLVEILNIRSVGPNLVLAPEADPTDGKFEVVLLKAADRRAFVAYVRQLQQGAVQEPAHVPWQIITATREISLQSDNGLVHVDDELITHKKGKAITIEIRPGIIDLMR